MRGAWNHLGRKHQRQWKSPALAVSRGSRWSVLGLSLLIAACGGACRRHTSPQAAFDHAILTFRKGDLAGCQREAKKRHDEFSRSDPLWARKFRILEAKAALWRGLYDEAERLLQNEPISARQPDLAVPTLTIVAIANIRTRHFPEAERGLNEAAELCRQDVDSSCGELLQAQGLLASERSDSVSAEKYYQLSLAFARAHGDSFLESTSLLNLGAESLAMAHYDEALDRSEAGYQVAATIDAQTVKLTTTSNIAWAYYSLGDSERALQLFLDAEKVAAQLQFVYDQENELTNIGYIYMDRRQYNLATRSFQQALDLAESIKAKLHIYNALRVMARLSLKMNQLDQAAEYAARALQLARESGIHADELYPRLIQGQVAARRRDTREAENTFLEVERDAASPIFLKWEAEHSLALLFEEAQNAREAERYYRKALATFEGARQSVRRQSSQLSFLTNGWSIYDDYIHFLVESGKPEEALRWADYSRARTLAEGLGILSGQNGGMAPPLHPQEIARGVRGTVLFYWLGDKQSYLWTISSQALALTALPPGAEINAVARRYWTTLSDLQTGSPLADPDGLWLYRNLIAPVRASVEKSSRVFVVPDGNLHSVNFETLIVPSPAPHFWIDDATIISASSLRVLGATDRMEPERRNLLLIGDSVAPNSKYPELPKAAAQVQAVAAHFPSPQERVITREQATPQAYLNAKPEQYSYIHFVAHGTASRLSPLDSAIILSKSSSQDDSFKLYAREIIQRPLRAKLVTISACYGAGTRSYSGEGLVGLSWAFLRAGAHDVIAALWEASDTPTEQLMAKFYDELNRGTTPSTALRTAKLSLLHNSAFNNPFYWAPFQLYTQGRAGNPPDLSHLRSEKTTPAQERLPYTRGQRPSGRGATTVTPR